MRKPPPLLLAVLAAAASLACAPSAPTEGSDRVGSVESATTTASAVADATVTEATPNANDGASRVLTSDGSPNRLAYLRFSIPSLAGAVASAKLRLFVTEGSTDAPRVHATSNDWSESRITWSNRPAPVGALLEDKGAVAGGAWTEYDVTTAISAPGDYSFVLVPTSADGLYMGSRESTTPPQLVVSTAAAGTFAIPSGNLTANASFEVGVAGWVGWQASLSRVAHASAPSGSYVAKVTQTTGTAYSVDDAPDTIPSAIAGASYEACAHLAAASSSAIGKKARVVIRERSTAGLWKETSSTPLALGSSFARACATATVQANGDVVDVFVQQDGAQPGDAFYADAVSLTPSTTAPAPQTIAKGVNFHCLWRHYDDAKRGAVLDALKQAGATMVRIDMAWEGFQPTGPNDWDGWYGTMADRCVDYAAARGLKVLLIHYLTPAWARNGAGTKFTPPSDPRTYANFARTLATRYGAKLAGIEIWNEPDPNQRFWAGTLAQYVDLLKAAYPAVHSAVSTPVVLGAPSSNDDAWIEQVYALGGKASFDILATHPYNGLGDAPPEHPDDGHIWWFTHFDAVKAVMDRHGDGAKTVWFTELGWSTHANLADTPNWQRGVTEAQQADFLTGSFAYAHAHYPNVRAMFWYNEMNETSGDVHQDNFGLLRTDLTPKPALHAFANVRP